jgi:hypothetical protein
MKTVILADNFVAALPSVLITYLVTPRLGKHRVAFSAKIPRFHGSSFRAKAD